MRYISVFSGIEAASVAWGPLGWEPVAFCEIDPFPSAVLAHRFPDVPNLGDITKVDWKEVIAEHGAVDVVVGGSPCQSFSIAGGREGLDGESRLMYEYIRCVQDVRPRWFLWENVPGVFSIDGGRAFGILLRAMEELGYGMAWRVLDAQFFGVAQRRRRVFLVGCLGEGGAPAAVLFEPESVSGNTQSSREKRQELARAAGRGSASGGGESYALNREIIPENGTAQGPVESFEVCPTLDTNSQPHGVAVYALQSDGSTSTNSHGDGFNDDGSAYTLNLVDRQSVVCIESGQANAAICEDHAPTLNCEHEQPIVIDRAAFNQGGGALFDPHIERTELMDSLVARGPHAVAQPAQEI